MADLKYNYIIESELEIFEKKFKESVKSKTPLLDRITHYIINRKGKQLRPRFVFLSAKLFGDVNDTTYNAASFVELLHTATLVHDDVVDDANERRGFFSVNALWKNKVAVLVGDYLLSKGMLLALSNDETELLKILSTAISKLIEGELLQLEKARNLNFKEDVYFEIITNKTASLLASVCASGAWSTTKDAEITEQMRLFGEKVGIAFQIKDDLFDYGTDDVGKPTGNDIKEKKLTLPLIHALQHASSSDKREMIYVIKNENTNKERVAWLISKVQAYGGINYAVNKMMEYRDDALAILDKFPKNEANLALVELVNYSTERKY
ncbi:polyprenyl synthetase family protein [Polluticaenibacter yanchengensis]|uniref:Polyprenyl synthetase family protein n=1 Tax=Polluticaenibacter yanchengensis TaxID=3014562 RepID=A0ABT4UN87_9BACT|nr:polyprenyl synthetase family protein [Chitinophagaceae bacterium LY-5]